MMQGTDGVASQQQEQELTRCHTTPHVAVPLLTLDVLGYLFFLCSSTSRGSSSSSSSSEPCCDSKDLACASDNDDVSQPHYHHCSSLYSARCSSNVFPSYVHSLLFYSPVEESSYSAPSSLHVGHSYVTVALSSYHHHNVMVLEEVATTCAFDWDDSPCRRRRRRHRRRRGPCSIVVCCRTVTRKSSQSSTTATRHCLVSVAVAWRSRKRS